MTERSRCFVVLRNEGRRIELGDFEMLVKADAEATGGVVSVLEATEPPGFGPPVHIHDNAAEAFYVLEGEYMMSLDGVEHQCPAGSFNYIPAGAPHGFRVGAVPSRKLNFYFPAAMIGYFDALASALAGADVNDAALGQIAEAHHMHLVGPPSERYV